MTPRIVYVTDEGTTVTVAELRRNGCHHEAAVTVYIDWLFRRLERKAREDTQRDRK